MLCTRARSLWYNLSMGLPKRGQPEQLFPESAKNEREQFEVVADSTEVLEKEDSEFEKDFYNDFPNFTAKREDVRTLSAIRRTFKLGAYDNLNIFVLSYDRENRDISTERVFEDEDSNNRVVFFTKDRGKLKALEARGHEGKKTDITKHKTGERADIIVMLDKAIRITSRLIGQAAPGSWLIVRGVKAANSLRARSKYAFKGVAEQRGGYAHVSRHEDPNFWKKAEVNSEDSFRQASDAEDEDVVTYEDARRAVAEAEKAGVSGMSEDRVFESYSKLIEMAEKADYNHSALADGETLLKLVITEEKNGVVVEKEITVNTALPARTGQYDDTIFVMHDTRSRK